MYRPAAYQYTYVIAYGRGNVFYATSENIFKDET